jgi:hypothetical protein
VKFLIKEDRQKFLDRIVEDKNTISGYENEEYIRNIYNAI